VDSYTSKKMKNQAKQNQVTYKIESTINAHGNSQGVENKSHGSFSRRPNARNCPWTLIHETKKKEKKINTIESKINAHGNSQRVENKSHGIDSKTA